MTDVQELIERLQEQRDRDAAEHCPGEIIALQDEAISALQRTVTALERIAGLGMSQFAIPYDMADEAQSIASAALSQSQATPNQNQG